MTACSERCGWCGRCNRSPKSLARVRPEPSRSDFILIHRGFVQAGLPRDYFGYEDIVHLWMQGKDIAQIIQIAIEHADRARRFSKAPA